MALPKKAKGERPSYFEDPAIDKILSIAMALAGEVAVMRDRVDTLERLLERDEKITREKVDQFVPTADVSAARDAWRDQFLEIVFRVLQQEREAMEVVAENDDYDAAVKEVERA